MHRGTTRRGAGGRPSGPHHGGGHRTWHDSVADGRGCRSHNNFQWQPKSDQLACRALVSSASVDINQADRRAIIRALAYRPAVPVWPVDGRLHTTPALYIYPSPRLGDYPHLLDMQVIARHKDRGALRLDHLHDQALCGPKAEGDLSITHIMPPIGSSAMGTARDLGHTQVLSQGSELWQQRTLAGGEACYGEQSESVRGAQRAAWTTSPMSPGSGPAPRIGVIGAGERGNCRPAAYCVTCAVRRPARFQDGQP
jgi:hypothetical protein